MTANAITIKALVQAPISKVWEYWNKPEHVTRWAFASDEWEAPAAENDLRVDGAFKTTMAAKDKSASFDFTGIYTTVDLHKHIACEMTDGRQVSIEFTETPEGVQVVQTFDPENENTLELQRAGWQAILDNFKKYVESGE